MCLVASSVVTKTSFCINVEFERWDSPTNISEFARGREKDIYFSFDSQRLFLFRPSNEVVAQVVSLPFIFTTRVKKISRNANFTLSLFRSTNLLRMAEKKSDWKNRLLISFLKPDPINSSWPKQKFKKTFSGVLSLLDPQLKWSSSSNPTIERCKIL